MQSPIYSLPDELLEMVLGYISCINVKDTRVVSRKFRDLNYKECQTLHLQYQQNKWADNNPVRMIRLRDNHTNKHTTYQIICSNDGKHVASIGSYGIELYRWDSQKTILTKVHLILQEFAAIAIAFSPDSKFIACVNTICNIHVFMVGDTNVKYTNLQHKMGTAKDIRIIFGRNSSKLISCNRTGLVSIWNFQDGDVDSEDMKNTFECPLREGTVISSISIRGEMSGDNVILLTSDGYLIEFDENQTNHSSLSVFRFGGRYAYHVYSPNHLNNPEKKIERYYGPAHVARNGELLIVPSQKTARATESEIIVLDLETKGFYRYFSDVGGNCADNIIKVSPDGMRFVVLVAKPNPPRYYYSAGDWGLEVDSEGDTEDEIIDEDDENDEDDDKFKSAYIIDIVSSFFKKTVLFKMDECDRRVYSSIAWSCDGTDLFTIVEIDEGPEMSIELWRK